jgi:hypothetical protein
MWRRIAISDQVVVWEKRAEAPNAGSENQRRRALPRLAGCALARSLLLWSYWCASR